MNATRTYDIAAYYWPAYHDEPRWRPFFHDPGRHDGEWDIIRRAQPKFPGHWQPRAPLWGFEDESDPRVMETKIAAASAHGVNVFIFDWYWYENQPFLEQTINQGFLGARNNDKIKFYLMWANHDATTLWDLDRSHQKGVIWPGAADLPTFRTIAQRVLDRYMKHPSYYKIDGRPVFSIYQLGTFIEGLGGIGPAREALDWFRQTAVAAGFPGVHVQAILWGNIPASQSLVPEDETKTQDHTIRALGIDGLTNYQWCHYVRPRGPYTVWGEQAIARWETWAKEFSVPFFPHVSIGWDTNPRFKAIQNNVIENPTPEAFADYLGKAKMFVDSYKLNPKLITINSWNEWSEGSYLEPDATFGMKYLEAVKKVFR